MAMNILLLPTDYTPYGKRYILLTDNNIYDKLGVNSLK